MLNFSVLADGIEASGYVYPRKSDEYTPDFREIQFNTGKPNSKEDKDCYDYYILDLVAKEPILFLITKEIPKAFKLEERIGDLNFDSEEIYLNSVGMYFLAKDKENDAIAKKILLDVNPKYGSFIKIGKRNTSFENKFTTNLSEDIKLNLDCHIKEPYETVRDSILSLGRIYREFQKQINLKSNDIK
jgi:hypothetical protein